MNMTRRTAAKALFVSAAGGLLLDRDSRALGADASKAAEEIIRTEVCVIGAGSGGTGAALAAARAGAKVVLLERDSVLGGTGTNGLVCVWRPVIGAKGIPLDLFREMRKDPLGVSPSIEYERTLLGPRTLQGKQVKQMRRANHLVLDHLFQLQTLPEDNIWSRKGTWKTWTISAIAPRIGIRETRRIVADYMLRENDIEAGVAKQAHHDVVAIADHCLDLHAPGIKNHDLEGPFGIPYRCLLPRGVKNLLVASRAAGFSHIAASSCRLQRTLITLGQAAGNAAALAVKHHVDPRGIDIAELQALLLSQGVDLHG